VLINDDDDKEKNAFATFTNCLTLDKHKQESRHYGAAFSTPAFSVASHNGGLAGSRERKIAAAGFGRERQPWLPAERNAAAALCRANY